MLGVGVGTRAARSCGKGIQDGVGQGEGQQERWGEADWADGWSVRSFQG